MDAPGKGMLKVVSILFIIFGALGTIITAIGLFAAMALSSMTAQLGGALESAAAELGEVTTSVDTGALQGALSAVSGILIVAMIIGIVGCLLELIVGIMGVGKAGDASKAGFFITTGIILCAVQLISIILTLITPNAAFPFMSLIGFVLPILYIVGGNQNKKSSAITPAA